MTEETDASAQPVLLESLRGGVLTLTLNRPERYNALNDALLAALAEAIGRAAANAECRVILLTGAGKGFCAGQDLSDRIVAAGQARPDLGEALDSRYNPLIRALRKLPKPVVCAVNGAAAGAGANIALACDIVLAAKSAKFLQAFARIGLVPDSGGTWILPRLVGDARARTLMMLADPIGAEEAAAWGMIYRAVADVDLLGEAHALTERLAAGPTHAYGLMKRASPPPPSTASMPSSTSSAIFSARQRTRRNMSKACGPSSKSGRRTSGPGRPARDAPGDCPEVGPPAVGGRPPVQDSGSTCKRAVEASLRRSSRLRILTAGWIARSGSLLGHGIRRQLEPLSDAGLDCAVCCDVA